VSGRFRFSLTTLFLATLFIGVAISSLVYPNPNSEPHIRMLRLVVLCPSIGATIGVFLGRTLHGAIVGLMVAYAAVWFPVTGRF
jgi:hypothetical protein